MKIRNSLNALMVTLAIAGLSACGGGGGGGGGVAGGPGAAATGSTVVGVIGGFGSVILTNGVEYDTDNVTTCEVDDVSASGVCEDNLAVGMSIKMEVDDNGAVTSIEYDDELEGPAANVVATGTDGEFSFEVFGESITTTSPGTQWRDFNTNPPMAAELDGANVEVSGEWQGGALAAMYVEKQSDSTHEAKGTVGVVTGSTFPLTLNGDTVVDVDATNANLIPMEGDYVEVKGAFDGAIFVATEIELEDEDDFDSDGEAKITGTLAENADSSTGFSIGDTDVNISDAPSCDGLVGTMVEAEGMYDEASDALLVEECENEDNDLEMRCLLGDQVSVDDGMPKAGSVVCTFPGATGTLPIEFRDMPDLAVFSGDESVDRFDLSGVNPGDCVEIEAYADDAGTLVAGLIELEGIASACTYYKLQGPVDSFTDNVSVTVLGVTYIVDDATAYPNGMPVTGNDAKIIDEAGDGVADVVKTD